METLYIQFAGLPSRTPLAAILERLDPLEGLINAGLERDEALELIYVNALRLEGAHDWAAMLSPRLRRMLSLNSRNGNSSTWTYFDGRSPSATQASSA